MNAEEIAHALGGARKAGRGFSCQCPVHDDHTASLSIADGERADIVVTCHAGCSSSAVLAELRARDLLNGHDRKAAAADLSISNLGKPSHVWTYRDRTGTRELLKVARYETASGKSIRPWVPAGVGWKCSAHATPRPLYRLDVLAANPGFPVLVTEGEKCADAAHELVGARYVCTTWPGGANAAGKADWAPLHGRDVLLWPDADEPGQKAMQTAAEALANIASKLRLVEPGERAKGWDLADAKAEGWTADDVTTYIDDHARTVVNIAPPDDAIAYDLAEDLEDAGDEADELVERLLARYAMGVLYGDSNSGKTFLAIDIACAIARRLKWMERNTEGGLVVYLAVEAPASVRRRTRAYQRYHGVRVPNFVIVKSPIDLYNGDADTGRIIDLVHKLERTLGVKCEIIIGDTLSRMAAGANENSGEDMSVVVRHIDRIRHECRAHFLLIHHSGKDQARGMRGWSGMRAATDTEIEVTADSDTGAHAAEITKQRDIPGKGDRIGFRLQVVEMGLGKWGQPITSCVVVGATAPVKQAQGRRPSEIAGAITEFLSTRGAGIKKRELVDHFEGRYTPSAMYREIKKMVADGKLRELVGIVALVQS